MRISIISFQNYRMTSCSAIDNLPDRHKTIIDGVTIHMTSMLKRVGDYKL